MAIDSFPGRVAEQLKWYVYRLIDPRNGETFYVGKGQGDRVFAHAKGEYANTGKTTSEEDGGRRGCSRFEAEANQRHPGSRP